MSQNVPTSPIPEAKTVAGSVMSKNYGKGSDWNEENQYGERGFTRAQAEMDIQADDIEELIVEAITNDRAGIVTALESPYAVPGFRPYPLATVDALIEAYEAFGSRIATGSDLDESDFVDAWNDYTAGKDFPCPQNNSGLHQVTDGSCDLCGDRNRS